MELVYPEHPTEKPRPTSARTQSPLPACAAKAFADWQSRRAHAEQQKQKRREYALERAAVRQQEAARKASAEYANLVSTALLAPDLPQLLVFRRLGYYECRRIASTCRPFAVGFREAFPLPVHHSRAAANSMSVQAGRSFTTALSNGRLGVVNAWAHTPGHTLKIFTEEGRLERTVLIGPTIGKPAAIIILGPILYVADAAGGCVHKFALNNVGDGLVRIMRSQFSDAFSPWGGAAAKVDGRAILLFADRPRSRVVAFDAHTLERIYTFGSPKCLVDPAVGWQHTSSSEVALCWPVDVAADGSRALVRDRRGVHEWRVSHQGAEYCRSMLSRQECNDSSARFNRACDDPTEWRFRTRWGYRSQLAARGRFGADKWDDDPPAGSSPFSPARVAEPLQRCLLGGLMAGA